MRVNGSSVLSSIRFRRAKYRRLTLIGCRPDWRLNRADLISGLASQPQRGIPLTLGDSSSASSSRLVKEGSVLRGTDPTSHRISIPRLGREEGKWKFTVFLY